ncbi:MAG: helix-turn-helix domain-containing protein [Candidatus Staskawiczbacteria bacterium]|nr:helix-turn-helix domain-containing protein [Candidatus Staskawiczbacteria bacterium]MBI3337610.1 helix-turn-helix domain-containing protein [Candidatus Staskawiczbacteria bacterium]
MALTEKRAKALVLRKQEMSYSQIKEILGVSKSTLSYWLRNYPLSKKRINELRGNNEKRIERYRETRRKTKEKRLKEFYIKQKGKIFPLNKRELFLTGLFLYWGEGSKTMSKEVAVSNTDPSVIVFFIKWINSAFKISKDKLKFSIHLYNDMNVNEEISFWAKTLHVSKNQFLKPYIKDTSSLRINQKGGFGHGTCNARLSNARLSEQILMAIKAISDKN